jgi:hypothetical protein
MGIGLIWGRGRLARPDAGRQILPGRCRESGLDADEIPAIARKIDLAQRLL